MEFVSLGKTAHLGPQNNKNVIIMPDRSGPGLTKSASDTVVQQGAVGKYATVGRRRKRGGKHVRDKQKRRMGRKMEVKVGTLNVGNMTWQRQRVGRDDDEEEGRHTMRAGDKVEGEQGQEHRRWLQNILPWRRWEEKWSMSYTE